MLRTILYNDHARTIRAERCYRNISEWDLPSDMKVWFEYPGSTRFARYPYDVLYTPIFFANEGISAHLCIEANESISGEIYHLTGEIGLVGTASLGLLNMGGRAANVYDARYAFSAVGFRSIVTVPVLDLYDTVSLDAGPYEQAGVVGRRVPISFPLPAQTLAELREMTPSLKLISSDTESTLDILKGQSPVMQLNVRYLLTAVLFSGNVQKQKIEQEIRIFVALDEQQVPSPLPDTSDRLTQHRRSSLVSLKGSRSLAFMPSRRKSFYEGGNHIIIEADDPKPFCFQTHSDAAATKVRLTLTYGTNDPTAEPPGPIQGNIEWLMKSLASIAVHTRSASTISTEDAFHLRTRHLPLRKLKMNWTEWTRPDPDENAGHAWKSVQDLWLTQPTTSGLTPTFRTSFISHQYSMWLQIALSGKGMKGRSYKVELNVPVKIRYDVGLAPSYAFDHSLPQYSVDEGAVITQQAGPPPEHPFPEGHRAEPPPSPPPEFEDVPTPMVPRLRFAPDELAELIRSTEGVDLSAQEQPPFQRRATTA